MGDFLPKSMFLNEIWVKNRPFSLFFGKISGMVGLLAEATSCSLPAVPPLPGWWII